jgi:Rrf2 family nitric oxide-sensitive transcriptional repressor
MRLTTYTDYSLRVLMYLSVRHASGELTTIDEISRSYSISKNHLMKIVHQLSLAGIVETTRGRKGGVRLALDPREISIGQVVRMSEPDFAIVECHEAGKEQLCALWQACNLKAGFRRAADAFLLELDRLTLADAIGAPSVAASLLGMGTRAERVITIRAAAPPTSGSKSAGSPPRRAGAKTASARAPAAKGRRAAVTRPA